MTGKLIVHHQGLISLSVPEGQNRVHLFQEKVGGLAPVFVTVVGRQNLDAVIAALQDVRERLS